MDLLSTEQVKQIREAAAAAGNEPGEALKSFGERLRDLRKENPHASEANLKEAMMSIKKLQRSARSGVVTCVEISPRTR